MKYFYKILKCIDSEMKITLYMAFSLPLKACIKILNIGKSLY